MIDPALTFCPGLVAIDPSTRILRAKMSEPAISVLSAIDAWNIAVSNLIAVDRFLEEVIMSNMNQDTEITNLGVKPLTYILGIDIVPKEAIF